MRSRAQRRGRGGRLVAAASAVCLVGGLAMTATAVAMQDDPVEPPLTSADEALRPSPGASPSPQTSPTPADPAPAEAAPPAPAPSSTDLLPPATPTAPPPAPTPAPPAPEPAQAPEPVADPVALRIPAIEVDSELLHLGLTDEGKLEVPSGDDFDSAAWYDGSPAPGEVGPTVIEGHIDSARNGPSVFFRLGELEPGDEVEVDRADGTTAVFAVDRLERYEKDEFPTRAVYGNTDRPEIRLITCGGPINASTGRHRDNTVVYGHLVRG